MGVYSLLEISSTAVPVLELSWISTHPLKPGKWWKYFHLSNLCNYSFSQVVRDVGRIQNIIGQILPETGQAYYVDAVRRGPVDFLYEYGGIEPEDESVQHLTLSNSGGDCLTYSSDGGSLQTSGQDCNVKRKPLCLRIDNVNDSAVSSACNECNSRGT